MSDGYEKGLEGEKPGFFDELRGQEYYNEKKRGYETHLRNRDLSEQLAKREEDRYRGFLPNPRKMMLRSSDIILRKGE